MKLFFFQSLVSIIICVISLSSTVYAQVTEEALNQLQPFTEQFEDLDLNQKKTWLSSAVSLEKDPVALYRLKRELVYLYNTENDTVSVLKICSEHPPSKFDLDYRLVCILANKVNDQNKLKTLVSLYGDAIDKNDVRISAEALSVIGWIQSSTGELEQAFRSYETALPLAESVNVYILNNISLNLALLYIVHGDDEYIEKGIALMVDAINRLKQFETENPNASDYTNNTLSMIYYNLGVAYTFHKIDYHKSIYWFSLVDPNISDLKKSVIVFSSLSHANIGNYKQAKTLLIDSTKAPASKYFNSDYLFCYQQVIKVILSEIPDTKYCNELPSTTPVEVKLDLFKRLVNSDNKQLNQLGLVKFYDLFDKNLKPLLKQNTKKSASQAELSRLQQESRLKGELIKKEKALTVAEKEKVKSQRNFTGSIVAIFILILVIVLLQLRQKQKLARQFAQMSLVDSLTGMHNRHYFEQNIQRELNFVKRAKGGNKYNPIGIYLFDIDHFKKINDNYGHDIGDSVLREFSKRINRAIRESDMLIRWGGEEFILVARLFEFRDYHQIAERVRKAICQSAFDLEGNVSLDVTCTVGGIIYPNTQDDLYEMTSDQLIKLADNALYMGKKEKRNCWVCIDSIKQPEQLESILKHNLSDCESKGLVDLSHSFN